MNKTSHSFLNFFIVKYVRCIRVDNFANAVPLIKSLNFICGDAFEPGVIPRCYKRLSTFLYVSKTISKQELSHVMERTLDSEQNV